MKKSNRKKNASKFRFYIVFGFIIVVFIIAISRLYYVQIVKGETYHREALNQTVKNYSINSKRGEIRDKNGKKIAINQESFTPWINSNELSEDLNIDKTVEEIASVIEIDKNWLRGKLADKKGIYKIKQWIEKEEAEKLKELNIKGLSVEKSTKRFYPFGSLASYVIGFTNVDNEGANGLELEYNDKLKGVDGKLTVATDAQGRPLSFSEEMKYDVENGLNLVTTIDMELQKILTESAEKALKDTSSKKATIICMEPKTGKILAMVSTPGFDLNDPKKPADSNQQAEWEKLSGEKLSAAWYNSWRNGSISNVYEPGSIFKIITAAMGIEDNVTREDKNYLCTGIWKEIKGVELRCVLYPKSHGNITLNKGFEESCNVVFIRLGMEIGRERFYKYINAFGFDESTGVDLPGESGGLIPPFDKFNKVSLATGSYGHGISVTPLQMINAAASVVNGGNLMQPYVVDRFENDMGEVVERNEPKIIRKVLSERTSARLNKMMRNVVLNGTGKRLKMPEYDIGAKTGTSIKMVDGKYSHDLTIASMVATVPSENPEYIFLGILDEPLTEYRTGGVVAGQMLRDALDKALPYLNVPKIKDEKNAADVPNLVGMNTIEAGKLLNSLGIDFKTEFENEADTEYVISQSIPAGMQIKPEETLTIKLGGTKEEKMPDLIGLKRDEAVLLLDKTGIRYKIDGEGTVQKQEPPRGELLKKDTVIEVYCKPE